MSNPTSKPSKKALRTSLFLPIVIPISVLLVGAFLVQFFPASQFNTIFGFLLGSALLLFLIFWTRKARGRLRLWALIFALPALAGITASLVQGRSRYIVIGVGTTFLLLVIQRAFQVPPSFRVASRYFDQGNYEQALKLINKAIEARPGFAESYQLRASIRLVYKQFAQAEADAKHAISQQPYQPNYHHTLGQIYLVEGKYAAAFKAFETAVSLDDTNAMHHYHKGVSAFRLENFQTAAEALSSATKKTLPLIEYDLLAHYYLFKALQQIKRPKLAAAALEAMAKFAAGVPKLEALVAAQADYEPVISLRQDIAAIHQLLGNSEQIL